MAMRRFSETHSDREARWRQTFDRQRASGLSIRTFCERERIAVSTFGWWRRKLAASRGGDGPAVGGGRRNGKPRMAFASVRVVPDSRPPVPAPTTDGTSVEVFLVSGHRLKVPAGFDPVTLGHLVTFLGA